MSRLFRTLQKVGAGYERYRIFALFRPGDAPIGDSGVRVACLDDAEALASSSSPELRALVHYTGTEALAFGLYAGSELAGACFYWFGERYRARGFIELPAGAAKLVQITTAPAFRGRGLAPILIQQSAQAMFARGFTPLYARVWHSHAASIRAFRKAGWTETSMVTTFSLPFFGRPFKRIRAVPAFD